MASPVLANPSEEPIEVLRRVSQYAYPAVLLIAFLVIGCTASIIKALPSRNVDDTSTKGPGGKPLPISKRKREEGEEDEESEHHSSWSKGYFQYATIFATMTFFAMGTNVAIRALYHRNAAGDHGWWCGQPKTVCSPSTVCTRLLLSPTGFADIARRSSSLAQLFSGCTCV